MPVSEAIGAYIIAGARIFVLGVSGWVFRRIVTADSGLS